MPFQLQYPYQISADQHASCKTVSDETIIESFSQLALPFIGYVVRRGTHVTAEFIFMSLLATQARWRDCRCSWVRRLMVLPASACVARAFAPQGRMLAQTGSSGRIRRPNKALLPILLLCLSTGSFACACFIVRSSHAHDATTTDMT